MNHKTILRMAKPFKRVIGAHHRLIGTGCDADEYYEAQRKSDEAVATCKYLIQMLDDRHAAVLVQRMHGGDNVTPYTSDVIQFGDNTFYRNKNGRCEDAPCCGCCTI